MKELVNYRLDRFLKLPEETITEYMGYLKFLKPIDTKRKLWDCSLKQVTFIKQHIETDNIWQMIEMLVMLGEKDPMRMPILEFLPKLGNIKEQLEQLGKAESNLIPAEPNIKMEMVGYGKKMSKFGVYNTLIPLSKQLNKTLEEVNEMNYGEVYTILLYNKTEGDLQNEMNKIKAI